MATPDIGLSFAIWLDKTRNSVTKQLLLCKKSLEHISIWDIGESGGFFHHYDNQHEQFAYTSHQHPASVHHLTYYYDEKTLPLHRPDSYNYTNLKKEYPLEGTATISTCYRCHGSGKIDCGNCGGTGKVSVQDSKGKSKRVNCSSCGGSGDKTCPTCDGEGKLLTYQSKDYEWRHTTDDEPIVAPIINRSSVRRLISKTHTNQGSYPVEAFSKEEVVKNAGVYNERIDALIDHARGCTVEKEKEINQRFGSVLFQQCQRFYIPLGFMNLFVRHKFGQFFIAGNLNHRSANSPPVQWSALKFMAWLSLGLILSILIGVAHGSVVIPPALMPFVIGIPLAFMVAGVIRFALDFRLRWPQRWFVGDDDGIGGWLFVHLLVQAISLHRQGYLLDPCYTNLFHLPEPDTSKSRNSFFCTIQTGETKTELFLASQRAIDLFMEETKTLTNDIQTFIWVINESPPTEVDQIIASLLTKEATTINPQSRLMIINCGNQDISSSSFPETQQFISPQQISCLRLPLFAAFDDLQHGHLTPKTEETLSQLRQLLNQPKTDLSLVL